MRTLLALLPLALSTCADSSAETAHGTESAASEPAAVEAEEAVVLSSEEPIPVGKFLHGYGSIEAGGVVARAFEKDGNVHAGFDRVYKGSSDGTSWSTTRSSSSVTSDAFTLAALAEHSDSPWFVYVHTTQELYLYDGTGDLMCHRWFRDDEGVPTNSSKGLSAGSAWKPTEELRASLPAALIEAIEQD